MEEAGADAKLIQHGPLGFAYHRRQPISTVPVAHVTVPSLRMAGSILSIRGFEVKHLIHLGGLVGYFGPVGQY